MQSFHGIETPEERKAAGKPAEGVIQLQARRKGGMLAITVSDDGRGIDVEQVRRLMVEKISHRRDGATPDKMGGGRLLISSRFFNIDWRD